MKGKPALVAGTFQVISLLDVVDAAAEMGAVSGYRPELFVFLKNQKILFGKYGIILKSPRNLNDLWFFGNLVE